MLYQEILLRMLLDYVQFYPIYLFKVREQFYFMVKSCDEFVYFIVMTIAFT